jgi:hypothetical protein
VSGTQLDPNFVELFVQVLAGKDVKFRHGEDADFDRELGIEKRVHDYSMPLPHVTGEPSHEAAELEAAETAPKTAETPV